MKRWLPPLLGLGVIQLVCHGIFAPKLGFYMDDWTVLEMASGGGQNFMRGVRAYIDAGFWWRPVEILHYPALFQLGGWNPAVYQAMMLALDACQGFLFFLVLTRLTGSRTVSFLAAALALAYPNRAATHHWFANSPQAVSLCLVLLSLLWHLDWLEKRKPLKLAGALAAYLVGVLDYESTAFLPLMLTAGLAAKSATEGAAWKEAWRSAALRTAPLGAALLALIVWQRAAAPWLAGEPNIKALAFDWLNALKTLRAGINCVTTRVAFLCGRASLAAWLELGPAAVAAAAGVAAFGAFRVKLPEPALGTARLRIAAAAGGAALLAGYLPYTVSSGYAPTVLGLGSRTSGVGALAGGLLLAALVCAAARRRESLARAGLALACFGFLCADWQVSSQWARSWALQQDILAAVGPEAAKLPKDSMVLLAGVPTSLNERVNPVPVFEALFAVTSALRKTTGRGDLTGHVMTQGMTFDADGVTEPFGNGTRRFPYKNLYLYRHDLGRLRPLGRSRVR